MKMLHILVSLADSVGLLKESFREQTALMIQNRHQNVPLMTGALNYNCNPYLTMLLGEIFNMGPDSGYTEISPSTKMLVAHGLPKDTAVALAHQVFQTTVDALSMMIPNLNFGNSNGYQVDMCGEFDAMVCPPVIHPEVEEELEYD